MGRTKKNFIRMEGPNSDFTIDMSELASFSLDLKYLGAQLEKYGQLYCANKERTWKNRSGIKTKEILKEVIQRAERAYLLLERERFQLKHRRFAKDRITSKQSELGLKYQRKIEAKTILE